MLDIKLVRENTEEVRRSIALRHLDTTRVDLDRLLMLDEQWRTDQGQLDELRARRNTLSSSIPKLDAEQRKRAIGEVKDIKAQLSDLEKSVKTLKVERDRYLGYMPNMLADDVPEGKTDEDNIEVSRWGQPAELGFDARDHVQLARITDTIDFERGAKVAGANFYYLKNEATLLELALYQYAAGHLLRKGFTLLSTPDLARDEILDGIGFAPRGPETQVYSLENTNLSLVGTAEITLGGYHSGEILGDEDLPLKFLGFSHCFRTESGAYGRESRGLYRVHQFGKAEMFVYCRPEESGTLHDEMLAIEELLLSGLKIPYRVVNVCSGDLGAPAAKKYDIEAWMPGRGIYGEVTSCSNCLDYQARRLNIRYRPEPSANPRFVHMLNGTAIAISRTLIAIFENYQREDGSIGVPEVLWPWMAGITEIPVRR